MSLRKATIRLAYERPDLRAHLLPLLARTASPDEEAMDRTAKDCTWGHGVLRNIHNDGDNYPTDLGKKNKKQYPDNCQAKERTPRPEIKEDAGANGSEQRKKYNKEYREKVCPKENNCGAPNAEWLKGEGKK